MKVIGKKIKGLRIKKGFTQDNILPDKQSNVVQIENGSIKRPTRDTLVDIAKGLEISFDELVKDTDWEKGYNEVKETQYYAISNYTFNVSMDNNNIFDISYKSYPLEDENGDKNNFCPESGTELIMKCNNCDKKINNPKNKFCTGCGTQLCNPIRLGEEMDELLNRAEYFVNNEGKSHAIGEISALKSFYVDDLRKILQPLLSDLEENKVKCADENDAELILRKYSSMPLFGRRISAKVILHLAKDNYLDKDKIVQMNTTYGQKIKLYQQLIDCIKDSFNKEDLPISIEKEFKGIIYSQITNITREIADPTAIKILDKSWNFDEKIKVLNELRALINAPVEEQKDFISKQTDKNNEVLSEEDNNKSKTNAPKGQKGDSK